MKRRIYPFLILLFFIAGANTLQAQQNSGFVMDSLQHQLSLKKTAKDSLYLFQKLADTEDPVDDVDSFGNHDYIMHLLNLNKKLKLIDQLPYQFLQQAVLYNKSKQYKQEIATIQVAIHLF